VKDFDEIFKNLDKAIDRGMVSLDKGMESLDESMKTLDRKIKTMRNNVQIKKSGGSTRIFIDGKEIKGNSDLEKVKNSEKVITLRAIVALAKSAVIIALAYMIFTMMMGLLHYKSDDVKPLNPPTQHEQTTNEFKQL